VVHCELDPGDVLIFHSNALHRSDQNRSPNRRWTLLVAYNAIGNDALVREDDRSYVPLDKVDDGAIKRAGLRFANEKDEHFAKQPFVPKVSA
jgi:ectoine hydroxylase-related dioxygenase (phytanoyl-CoA dioxygenase family)